MKVAIMKGAALGAAIILCCGHAWYAPGAAGHAAQTRGRAGASAARAAQTKALFDEQCARCHGEDGRGRTKLGEMLTPPDFTSAEWQRRTSDARMRNSVRDGSGQMPAFARRLSRREIAALVAYVRGFAKPGR